MISQHKCFMDIHEQSMNKFRKTFLMMDFQVSNMFWEINEMEATQSSEQACFKIQVDRLSHPHRIAKIPWTSHS